MTERDTGLDGRLKAIIVRHAGIEASEQQIEPDTNLVDDLQMDSMMVVHLFADLEEEFRIRIDVTEMDTPVLNEYRYLSAYIGGLLERGA